jgi:hypothetical protein
MPGALANDGDRRGRFEREAQLLASLNHPHVAQISNGARGAVRWRRDGRELLYLGDDGKMMAVEVSPGDELRVQPPRPLFTVLLPQSGADGHAARRVTIPDGHAAA